MNQLDGLTTTDLAVGGLIVGLLIASNFQATGKYAVMLGLFLLILTWLRIYDLKIIPTLIGNINQRFNIGNVGEPGNFYNDIPGATEATTN
jgi:hypothetical protein